jgi:hypothetical protein
MDAPADLMILKKFNFYNCSDQSTIVTTNALHHFLTTVARRLYFQLFLLLFRFKLFFVVADNKSTNCFFQSIRNKEQTRSRFFNHG